MHADTRSRLLHEAEILIRTRGYAAFSYADLAERVGITKASVHYYFPGKEALMADLLREFVGRFREAIAGIRQVHADAGDRLRAYGQLFVDGFAQGLLPLCGALSAERAALPPALRPEVTAFFQLQLDWLREVIGEGVAQGAFGDELTPDQAAMLLLSTLEGGSFVGWALEQQTPVIAAFEAAMSKLESGASVRRPKQ